MTESLKQPWVPHVTVFCHIHKPPLLSLILYFSWNWLTFFFYFKYVFWRKKFYFATVNETLKFSFAETKWNIKVNMYLLHRFLTNYKGKKLEWRNLTDTTPSKKSEFTTPETGQTAIRGLLIRCTEKGTALLQCCSGQKYVTWIFIVYLFLAALGLHRCVWTLSCSEGKLLSSCTRFSLWWLLLLGSTGSRCMGSVVVVHGFCCPVVSSQIRDQTHVPCIHRQILNHWNTRAIPITWI